MGAASLLQASIARERSMLQIAHQIAQTIDRTVHEAATIDEFRTRDLERPPARTHRASGRRHLAP